MPDISRLPVRMDASVGLDLVSAQDRCPPGSFLQLTNARVVDEGRLDGRPGYTPYGTRVGAPKLLHSIRRLNDPDDSFAANGYSYIVGNGTLLESGTETSLAQVDTGYSGNPLSILTFRPEASPESWAYVYDANKQSKVRPDGTVRAIGAAPPNSAPNVEYGQPASASVAMAQSSAGWGFSGATTGVSTVDRTNGGAFTIGSILYATGTTGWACITPSAGITDWAGERMKIILNGTETVAVREIHAAITSTTIQAIQYDSGSTGLCSLVLAGLPTGVARNSVIQIVGGGGTESVRVLSSVLSPDGSAYSIRCVTANNHAAGATVNGQISWYCYTTINHAAGEAITSNYISASQPAAGTGAVAVKTSENSGNTNLNRPVDTANDYLHISLFLQNPLNVVELDLLVDVDPATALGTAFTGNFWQWTITLEQIGTFGTNSGNVWVEIVVPISQGIRHGGNLSYNFSTVQAVGVSLTTTGACAYGFDWWYFFGTYGPVIQPNAPVGYAYESRFRDSSTGAASVPGPTTRYTLNPLRESVIVTPATTTTAGIDYSDIYREGGTITDFAYIGSVQNNNASPNSFTDGLSDQTIASNPSADLTLLQPWPILGLPLSGTVNVVGSSVVWASGSTFPLALVSNTVILLNGVAYLTRGQPKSSTFLELESSAGVLSGASFSVQSPTLAGQPLPFAFGPLEGPFAPVAFALGDPINGGTLYFSNGSNLDGASDQNSIELCGPTEGLVSGDTWNGLVLAGSRENVYLVRASFVQTAGAAPYQWSRLPSPSGFWSRWTVCRGPDGVYALGRDGIYRFTEQGGENITNLRLYPLFPHDGQDASPANGYNPVDMTQIDFMRMSCLDQEIRFVYLDTNGVQMTMRYEIQRKRWFIHKYGDSISYEYLNEPSVSGPNNQSILYLSRTLGLIYQVGGNDDNGVPITSTAQTPYMDGGDERAQKLHVDYLLDVDQTGTVVTQEFYNNGTASLAPASATLTGPRVQTLFNASSVPAQLSLYRNVSLLMTWTGGPAGPRIYAFEPAWYIMPYLSLRVTTQYIGLSFPGWKTARRAFPAVISTSPVTFLIQCQDGRAFTITIPSTNGQFLIQPIMLPQCIKSLAFAFQVDGGGSPFALFIDDFTVEWKEWSEGSFVKIAPFKS